MIKKSQLQHLLIFCFFSFIFLRYKDGSVFWLLVLPIIGFLLLLLSLKKKAILYTKEFTFLTFVFLLISFLSAERTNFYSVFFTLLGSTSYIIACLLYKDKEFSLKLSYFLLYSFLLYCIFSITISHKPPYETLNSIFPDASRNVVGAICIFLFSFHTLAYYRVKSTLPVLALVFTFYLVVSAYGRSSILSFFILAIAYLIFFLKKKFIYLSSILIILIISILFMDFDINNSFLSFNQSGLQSPRTVMYTEYLNSLSFYEVIFGSPMTASSTIVEYNGNSHSSYIRAHSFYGIFPFLLFLYLLLKITSKFKINFIVLLVTITYLFRSSFEQIAFFDVFDFLFFYCLLFLVENKKKDIKHSFLKKQSKNELNHTFTAYEKQNFISNR